MLQLYFLFAFIIAVVISIILILVFRAQTVGKYFGGVYRAFPGHVGGWSLVDPSAILCGVIIGYPSY